MSTERDTHFAGFAAKLWQEMMALHNGIDVGPDGLDYEYEERYKALIAQRAYDLAYHFIESAYQHRDTFRGEIHASVQMLPDLDTWPESH